MDIISVSEVNIDRALQILKSCGIVAHATETCYGLACDLSNPEAVAKLFAVKHRPEDQPVSALFASLDEAKKYVEWNTEAEKFVERFPGPFTLILPITENAPWKIFPTPSGGPSVGIRVSSHPLAQMLIEKFGHPLSTTSANVHGEPPCYSAEDIVEQFDGRTFQPDLVLDSGKLPVVSPSQVISLLKEKEKIIRL